MIFSVLSLTFGMKSVETQIPFLSLFFFFLFKVYKTKWLDSERKIHLLVWAPPLDPLLGFAYRWLQLFYQVILPALCNYLNLSNKLGSCSEIDFYWIHGFISIVLEVSLR